MTRLLILDGNSVLHRAYYAMPDWRNRSGEATAGVYGFLSMMLRVMDELKPTHIGVVFDCPGPTFRHNMYVGYQVTREKDRQVSEDIWGQVEKLRIVFERMGVGVFSVPGFEADDVIGTIAKKAETESVVVVTGDRDLMQLVDDKVNLYMPQKGLSNAVMVDRDKVKERLGVWPEQVADYKALVGDSSDNYPGVAGIGPKTAVALLERYKDFEEVVEKANNEKITAGYEAGELSKRLATIKIDVPLRFRLEELKVPSENEIASVLKELGYKSLVKRVSGEGVKIDDSRPKLFD